MIINGTHTTKTTNRIFGSRALEPRGRGAAAAVPCARPRGGRRAAVHAAVPRRSRVRAAARPLSAAAARRGGILQPGCAGSQPGAQQRGPRLGRRAAALGRRRRGWTHRQTGCSAHDGGVGGAGEGAWRRVGASRRRRNGRVAPYAAARLTGRALGRAGRQNVGNFPAHPTSLFSPPSARGEPRHVGCSASSTASARPHALFRGFSFKNFAGTGPISRPRVVLLQTPCGGTKCACFRACARVCRGGSLAHF